MKPESLPVQTRPPRFLVVVDERHPEPVILLPLDLVGGRPAVPVGTMPAALGREIVPHRLPGVVLVPVGLARAHQVPVGVVDGEGRHEGEADLEESFQHLVPPGRTRLGALSKHLAGHGEAEIFVVVIVVEREVLDDPILEQRLGQAVIVLGAGEAPLCGRQRIHARHRHLRVVAPGAEAELAAFVERRLHDGRRRHRRTSRHRRRAP